MAPRHILLTKNLLLGFTLIACFILPLSAFSHAVLVKSQPEVDGTITQSPAKVEIWFNENISGAYKALAIINSEGKRFDNKDVKHSMKDRTYIYASTQELPPDTYTVRYRVMSADTHIVTGRYKFTVVENK